MQDRASILMIQDASRIVSESLRQALGSLGIPTRSLGGLVEVHQPCVVSLQTSK